MSDTSISIVGFLLLVLFVLAAISRALDVLWDRQDKEILKQKILEFWIKISEIGFVEQLRTALNARYRRTRALRKSFIMLFWAFCLVVVVATSYDSFQTDEANQRQNYKEMVEIDFASSYFVHCAYLMWGEGAGKIKTACDPKHPIDPPKVFEIYRQRQTDFENLLSQIGTTPLLLSTIGSTILATIVLAVPLTLALWLSLNLTLWILSRITQSRLKFALLVLTDIIVAIFMPPLLSSTFMIVMVGTGVLLSGQIIDLTSFASANWSTLTLRTAGLEINFAFIYPALFFLLTTVIPTMFTLLLGLPAILVGVVWMAINRTFEFTTAAGKVLRLDFSNDFIQATIDWAIFTDLLFSATYLIPCLCLVLANRSETTRKLFLNLVMWVGDHSQGPLVALSEIFSSVFTFFARLFTGKK
jgi:hypothetical protein